MPIVNCPAAHAVQRSVMVSVVLAAVLVLSGLAIFPASRVEWKETLPGLLGVGVVLGAYALLGVRGASHLERTNGRLLRIAIGFGLFAASIYAIEIVLEYVLLPRDNTRYGYVEFGLIFLCYLGAGFIAGLTTSRVRSGLNTAMGAALISTLVWYRAPRHHLRHEGYPAAGCCISSRRKYGRLCAERVSEFPSVADAGPIRGGFLPLAAWHPSIGRAGKHVRMRWPDLCPPGRNRPPPEDDQMNISGMQ